MRFPITDKLVRSPLLDAAGIVSHGFSTRGGGVSSGSFESLNLATPPAGQTVRDSIENVRENRRLFLAKLGAVPDNSVRASQVHGGAVRRVGPENGGSGFTRAPDFECDGLCTDSPGLALCVSTADCAPVLLLDPVRRAAAAVHSGWPSTSKAIVCAAVGALTREFGSDPRDVLAAIGPCAGACCYEVGADVREAMEKLSLPPDDFARVCAPKAPAGSPPDSERGEKYVLDLAGINRLLLLRAGLRPENISLSGFCTICSEDLFFSHRRTGHPRGGMLSAIMLREVVK